MLLFRRTGISRPVRLLVAGGCRCADVCTVPDGRESRTVTETSERRLVRLGAELTSGQSDIRQLCEIVQFLGHRRRFDFRRRRVMMHHSEEMWICERFEITERERDNSQCCEV